jgi:hypothetical protein
MMGDNVWNKTGNPYWMESAVVVPQGSSLTIEPGVTVFVNGDYGLISDGNLSIRGTPADRVILSPNGSVPEWEGVDVLGGRFHATGLTITKARLWVANTFNAFLDRVEIQGQADWSTLALFDVVNPTIGNVTITRTGGGNAIQATNATNLVLHGFDLSGGGSTGVHMGKCLRCTITEGTIESFMFDGVELTGDNCLVSRVTISGSNRGIAYGGNGSLIERNSLLGNNLGIQIFYSNNTVANNTILNPGTWGIVVNGDYYPATGNVLIGNTISGAGFEGITLDCFPFHPTYCDHNVLAYNTIENRNIGLRVFTSNHDIHGNAILGNAIGADVEGSNNRIYHNHFTGNTQQALDPGVGNRWDDGYPSGGNWWSDYVGVDFNHGQWQNIPGSDGIGDTPYVIDADSKDNYPFFYMPLPPPPRHVTARADGFPGNVVLEWEPPPLLSNGRYLIYAASTPTGFDFSAPNATVDSPMTTWSDFGAALAPGPKYYVVRALNTTSGAKSPTSNTAGKWTHLFPSGLSTFSLPLAPYPWVDYTQPSRVDTAQDILFATGATSVAYMEAGGWATVPGAGDPGHRLVLGEGYGVRMADPTSYTFVGLPASMISYEESPPLWYTGFGQADATRIWATPFDTDVRISWIQPPGMMPMRDSYRVYYSSKRDGFFGFEGLDYLLLGGAPIVAPWGPVANAFHSGALSSGHEWYYMVVPFVNNSLQGSGSYSVGVFSTGLGPGYSAIGLPLRPYANGTFLGLNVSFISSANILGVQWLDFARNDWVARQAWMPPGMDDTELEMVMAVQVDASVLTSVVFTGV